MTILQMYLLLMRGGKNQMNEVKCVCGDNKQHCIDCMLECIDKLRAENKTLEKSNLEIMENYNSMCDKRMDLMGRYNILRKSRDELLEALNWALGAAGNFKQKPDGAGNYWWRTELRERANLTWDSEKLTHTLKESK